MTHALDKLTFNLVPEGLPMPDIDQESLDQETANDIYRDAYRAVYNEWPRNDLGKHWQAAVANSRAAQMDFKTFCIYVIAGYFITHEHTPFFPVNLSAPSSLEKLESYRKVCKRKFNATDAKSLGLMLNLELYDIDEEMLRSEIGFGRYVTALVAHGEPLEDIPYFVYDRGELEFSPYFLSTEKTYQETVFMPYIKESMRANVFEKKTLGTPHQLRHRHLVSQVISALKRRTHLASTIFASRSRIMPKATKTVLDLHGLKPGTPISNVNEITDAYEFWIQVGKVAGRKD